MWSNEKEQHSKEPTKYKALQCHLSNSPLEDEDDGPPPGFDSVPVNLSTHQNENPEEEDDDDDGPPPGFLPISMKEYKEIGKIESFEEDDDDDDDGPPPGFHSVHAIKQYDDVSMPNFHSVPVIELEKGDGFSPNSQSGLKTVGNVSELGFQFIPVTKEEKLGNGFELGFQLASVEESELGLQSNFNVKEEKIGDGFELKFRPVSNKEEEKERDESELGSQPIPMIEDEKEDLILEKEVGEDDDDEGSPPGWGSFSLPKQPMKLPSPHHQPPSTVPSGTAAEPTHVEEDEIIRDEFDVGSQSVPMKEDEKERDGSEHESQSFYVKPEEKRSSREKEENEDKDGDDEGPPPGWDSFRPPRMPTEATSPPQLPPLTPVPTNPRPSATASGKAQMVCGSCRTLLSYSKGSRFVQCSCCQTVNLVLEEHQVGQVKCRGCTVLLMYPYGAPSVQCSSCLFVTKIGVQNKRPPLSMQQGRSTTVS